MVLVCVLAAGCSSGGLPLILKPRAPALPVASTPAGAVAVFVRAYDTHDLSAYRTLFTTDFAFAFSPSDVAGGPYEQSGWSRSDELLSAANLLLNGNTTLAPAQRIDLAPQSSLIAIPDDRPGKDSPQHVKMTVYVRLVADLGAGIWDVSDNETFYFVRGDAASVPPGIISMPADSTRWYIERWEEGSGGLAATTLRRGVQAPAQTMPGERHTWGGLKAMYHSL